MHRCWHLRSLGNIVALSFYTFGPRVSPLHSFNSLRQYSAKSINLPILSDCSNTRLFSFGRLKFAHNHQYHACCPARQAGGTMELDGQAHSSSKRRQSPDTSAERPTKQLKPRAYSYEVSNGTSTDILPAQSGQELSMLDGIESEEEDKIVPLAGVTADTAEWQATIERVVRSVVSIHFCQTCSFDTDVSCSSEATGFVVDTENGYILTNRHVVCAGPFRGHAIFDNHEEVSQGLE